MELVGFEHYALRESGYEAAAIDFILELWWRLHSLVSISTKTLTLSRIIDVMLKAPAYC